MASIKKKDNGRWLARVSFKDPHTNKFKTKSSSFKTKAQANEWARKMELSKNNTNLSKMDISFYDYYIKWINTYRINGVMPNTVNRYKHFGKVVKNYFKDKGLADITRMDYQNFLNDFGSKHSKDTVKRFNNYFRAMCAEAIDENVIHRDFTKNSKLSYAIEPRDADAKFLEIGDFETLMKHTRLRASLDNTSALEIYFICKTGTRYEEAAGLPWDCVNFKDNTIRLKQAYVIQTKSIGKLKNQFSYRTIKVNPKLMDLLERQKEQQEAYYKTTDKINEHSLVFRNKKLENPGNTDMNKMLHKLEKECKIQKQVNIHDLRHTHVSYLHANGYDWLYISKRIGHANTQNTIRVYSHLMKQIQVEHDKDIMALLDKD